LDVNYAPPTGEAGPSRFQLTSATQPQTLSQILGDMQISAPPAPLLAPHPNMTSALVFSFPCTQGSGHEFFVQFAIKNIYGVYFLQLLLLLKVLVSVIMANVHL